MRFAAVLVLATGCAATTRGMHVAVDLTGNGAGPAEQQRCRDAVAQTGAVVDRNASVQALVTLGSPTARLQVVTMRRGLVRDEARASASIEALCHDAALAAAAAREPPATPPPPDVASQPRAAPAPTSTSGNDYRGPISDQ